MTYDIFISKDVLRYLLCILSIHHLIGVVCTVTFQINYSFYLVGGVVIESKYDCRFS